MPNQPDDPNRAAHAQTLHLIHQSSAAPLPVLLTLLRTLRAALPAAQGPVWALGDPIILRVAQQVGLSIERILPHAPTHRAALDLRRALEEFSRTSPPPLIHAWSHRLATPLSLAAPRNTPVLFTLAAPLTRPLNPLTTHLLSRKSTQTLALTYEAAASLRANRWPASSPVTTADPPALPALVRQPARRPLRMRFGSSGDTEKIALLIGHESAPPHALMSAALGIGLAAEAGHRLRLLIPPDAPGLIRTRTVLGHADRSRLLITDPAADSPWESGPAADLALVLGSSVSLPWAVAANLPLVAAQTPELKRLIPQEAAAWFPPGSPGQLAKHAARLAESAELRSQLAQAARAAFAASNSPQSFIKTVAGLYPRSDDHPSVLSPAPTAAPTAAYTA